MSVLFDSLYRQVSPMFEVIVPESMVQKGLIPEAYVHLENVRVLPDKGYMRSAKKAARSKWVVTFRKPVRLDIRVFRLIYKVRKKFPAFVTDTFFPVMIKGIDFLLTKRIVK